MKQILNDERKAFRLLWHAYHAKHNIPYVYDEADDFFDKLTLIFLEGHGDDDEEQPCDHSGEHKLGICLECGEDV